MKLRALVMRFFRGPATDEPVYLHVSAPTVSPDEAAKLAARPVCRPTGANVLVFGGAKKLLEDQPDYGERQPVDYEKLPAA